MKNCYGNHVFITGASSGIGRACAEMFAKEGCQVTGISRNCEEKTEHFAGGGSLTMKRADVTDASAVRAAVDALPQIDIAVLCAGMGVAGPAEELPMELVRKQMEVNYFGTVTVSEAVLPRMRQQKNGLLILIGSIAGRVPIPMQSHYSSSKYALEAFSDAVRMEMKPFGVRACIVEPGDTKTGFTAARMYGVSPDSPYYDICRKSVAKMEHDEQNGRPPASVAEAVRKLVGKKNPPARVPVGIEYKLLMQLLRVMPDRTKEWILTKMYLPGS